MIKTIILMGLLIISIGNVCAGEIVTDDNSKVYIYGEIEDFVYMSSINNEKTNYNRTMCINATCVEGEISICGNDDYELEYNFIANINDTAYISRILIIKQELISSRLLSGKTLERNLTLDGILIGSYTTKTSFFGKTKKNKVYFDLVDNNIRFGSDIIINESLAFTQLNYVDQQIYLPNVSKNIPKFPIYHKYRTVGYDGESSASLTGLTGVFYNLFGDSVLTKLPIVGDTIASFGKAMQSVLFLPLTIIQFTFNFIFTFLLLIVNNWWYGLMVIEIFCIMPALKYKTYPARVSKYIDLHVKIFKFMYEVVILNIINLILRLVEIIRNLFRI